MAKKRPTNSETPEQKIAGTFTEMLINKIEKMKVDWKQPWVPVNSVTPRNMDGKRYSGMNALMLMMLCEKEGYKLPYFMTFHKALEMGTEVKKGEKSFPVYYWNINVKDKDGKPISYDDYKALSAEERNECKVYPFLKVYNVFNIQQTRFPELKPEEYAKMVEKLSRPVLKDENDQFRCVELDYMLKNKTWLCPIETKLSNDAYYSISKDSIVVPEKKQFEKGEEFYGTLLHEMAHSTGSEARLNREFGKKFGSAEYAIEELVAEMTSAIVCNEVGISKGVKDQSVAYLQSWLNNLKENPKFILTLMGDINKAAALIQDTVFSQEMEKTIKTETMENISSFLDEKAEQEKEPKHKVFTQDQLSQQTGTLHRHRFGEYIPEQAAQSVKPDDIHPAYEAYSQAKEQYPEEVILVMDKNDFYCFDKDADRIAGILQKEVKGQDEGRMVKFNTAEFDKITPVIVREAKMRITSMANVKTNMKAQAEQTNPDVKKLHMGYLGNGIALWEAGDDEYTAHIDADRHITVNEGKYFDEANIEKIKQLKESGNMIVGNNGQDGPQHLVLNPLKTATALHYNEVTGVSTPVSIETVKGKQYPVVAGSRNILQVDDHESLGKLMYPKDFTFKVTGIDNVRDKIGMVHDLGINIDACLDSIFLDILSDLEENLDALERKQYSIVFQVNDHKITNYAKDRDKLDVSLPNFYFKDNHLKFNTPGLGQELGVPQQMLTGDRIIKVQGLDNMKPAIEKLGDMGVSFKSARFFDNQIKGIEDMAAQVSDKAERDQANLYLMIVNGVVTDTEPNIDEQEYKQIPMYRFDKGSIVNYQPEEKKIITNQNNKVMEENKNQAQQQEQGAEQKKQHKDGIQVYQTTTSKKWVVQAWQNGESTPARAISQDDLKEYFDSVKGKTGKEVQDARQKLYDKYLSPEAEKARAERQAARDNGNGEDKKFIPPMKLPEITDDVRNRIGKASVYTMSDGKSHAVRAEIDGVMQAGKRIPDGMAISFLKGYKDLSNEERNERAAQVASYAYKSILEAPKQEQSKGIGR